VKLRGRKYWRKRQTCNGNVAAVEGIEYGDRVPFLGCPDVPVINMFTAE